MKYDFTSIYERRGWDAGIVWQDCRAFRRLDRYVFSGQSGAN